MKWRVREGTQCPGFSEKQESGRWLAREPGAGWWAITLIRATSLTTGLRARRTWRFTARKENGRSKITAWTRTSRWTWIQKHGGRDATRSSKKLSKLFWPR